MTVARALLLQVVAVVILVVVSGYGDHQSLVEAVDRDRATCERLKHDRRVIRDGFQHAATQTMKGGDDVGAGVYQGVADGLDQRVRINCLHLHPYPRFLGVF